MQAIKTIGFIGVGVMGEPMCRHLAQKSGATVLACDRDAAPLARLAACGVRAATMAEVSAQADIVFLSLPSGEVVESVVLGENGLLAGGRAGQIIVDLSTSTMNTARKAAEAMAARGMKFADAPVMRTRAAAEAGTLAVPVGADDALFALVAPFIPCSPRMSSMPVAWARGRS